MTQWSEVMLDNYGNPEIELVRGEGIHLFDSSGRKYLDFLGGIATSLLGHAHPEIVSAVTKQVSTLSHVSNLYAHPMALQLAKKLTQMSGGGRVFFCNSGAEANEAAIKISRLTGKGRIIATDGAFHGRTMGALSLTGQPNKRAPFEPLVPGITHVPFGDLIAMEEALALGDVAMVIVEAIQGEAGVILPPVGYLSALRDLTTRFGALLACDEVQGGMGRTGRWFSYQHEGITPDIVTVAKGLGGGLPLGATIAVTPAAQLFTPGSHGTTFGGNPTSCAAALATIAVIESNELLESNARLGGVLKDGLSAIGGVHAIRGVGLWIGMEVEDAPAVVRELQSLGVLVNAAGPHTIRLAPPYIVTDAEISEFTSLFEKAIRKVTS
ncbi:MAG: acetylornithine transaminase [Actinomycetes bacterium]